MNRNRVKMKHDIFLKELKEEYTKNDLIKIIESDRYDKGDIGFKDDFNHSYIQEYVVLDSETKEKYVKSHIKELTRHFRNELEKDIEKLKETLRAASNFFDTRKYIDEITNFEGVK